MEAARLQAIIEADTGKAEANIKSFGGKVQEAGGHVGGFIKSVGGIAGGMAVFSLVAGGISLVKDQLTDMVKSGMDANATAAQTVAVLKSTNGAAGVTADGVEKLSTQLMNLTGIDDDTVTSTQNMLLTFTNIGSKGGVFDQATKTALDMSVALGQDTKSSAIQLGKALNDPVKGITALQRVGVTFDETQKKQIANFMQAGDVASAQGVILKELNKEFGGSAEAAGKANGGIKILLAQFDNMKQTIGQAIIPILNSLMSAVLPIISGLSSGLPGAIQSAGSWLSFFGGLLEPIGETFIKVIKPALGAMADAFTSVGKQINDLDFSEIVQTGKLLAFTFGNMLRDAFVNVSQVIKHVDLSKLLAGANQVGQAVLQLAQYVQANVLPVVAQFGGFIVSTILPALAQFGGFIMANVVPALAQLFEWASANVVPVVEKLAKIFINNVMPALEQVWNSISKNLIPALEHAWEAIAPKLMPILEKLGAFLKNVIAPIIANVVVPVLGFLIARIGDVAGFILGFIDGALGAFGDAWTGLSNLIGNVWNGIVGIVRDGVNSVIDQINQVIDLANNIPGVHFDHLGHVTFGLAGVTDKGGGKSATVLAGGGNRFAEGGITPGGPVLVGERGPELIAPPRGSRVFTAQETAKMLGNGSGSQQTINIYPQKADLSADDLARHMRRAALHASTGGAF